MSKKIAENLSHPQKVKLLYKAILKMHKGLPAGLKALGDQYTKDEFKRHKTCNSAEAQLFVREWTKYAVTLSEQLGIRGKPKGELGDVIDEETLQHLRDEQVVQLYELMVAAKSDPKESHSETHKVEVIDNHKK